MIMQALSGASPMYRKRGAYVTYAIYMIMTLLVSLGAPISLMILIILGLRFQLVLG